MERDWHLTRFASADMTHDRSAETRLIQRSSLMDLPLPLTAESSLEIKSSREFAPLKFPDSNAALALSNALTRCKLEAFAPAVTLFEESIASC